MKARVNPRLAAELAASPGVAGALEVAARAAKRQAEAASPKGGPAPGYAARFRVTTGATVRLENLDIAAHIVEWGSANNPPYAPLRRGTRAAGLRITET